MGEISRVLPRRGGLAIIAAALARSRNNTMIPPGRIAPVREQGRTAG